MELTVNSEKRIVESGDSTSFLLGHITARNSLPRPERLISFLRRIGTERKFTDELCPFALYSFFCVNDFKLWFYYSYKRQEDVLN
jgi:hypothetical protein